MPERHLPPEPSHSIQLLTTDRHSGLCHELVWISGRLSITDEDLEKAQAAAAFQPEERATLSNVPWVSSIHFRQLFADSEKGARTVFTLPEARVMPLAHALAEGLGCTVLQKVEVGYNTVIVEEVPVDSLQGVGVGQHLAVQGAQGAQPIA